MGLGLGVKSDDAGLVHAADLHAGLFGSVEDFFKLGGGGDRSTVDFGDEFVGAQAGDGSGFAGGEVGDDEGFLGFVNLVVAPGFVTEFADLEAVFFKFGLRDSEVVVGPAFDGEGGI